MKKILLAFLIFSFATLWSQKSDQSIIREDTSQFMTKFQNKDYDGILDMTHPAIFEKFDKETLKSLFQKMLEDNEEFQMEIIDTDKITFEISEVMKTKDTKYAFVTHPMKMKMTFKNQKFDDSQKEMMVNMMEVQGMKTKFLNENFLEMSKQSMMIAMNDASTKNQWKYLNYDETNPLYVSVVPVEIMKKAKNYYADFLIKNKENAN